MKGNDENCDDCWVGLFRFCFEIDGINDEKLEFRMPIPKMNMMNMLNNIKNNEFFVCEATGVVSIKRLDERLESDKKMGDFL